MPDEITGEIATSPVAEEQNSGQVDESGVTAEEGVVSSDAGQESEGLKQAMIAERRKAQAMAAELESARRAAEFYRNMAMQDGARQPGIDPDGVPTAGQVNEIVQQHIAPIVQEQRQRELARMDAEMREKYPDYDEVFQNTLDMTSRPENEGLAEAILKTANPAMTAYMLGKTSPNFEQSNKKRVAQNVAKKIEENLNKQKTLSDVGGGAAPVPKKDWSQATDAEIDAHYRKILGL